MYESLPDTPELLDESVDYVESRLLVPLPTYFIGGYGMGAPKGAVGGFEE